MAVTIASLRAAHREFAEVDHPTDAEVQAAIDHATSLLDQAGLGALYDNAVDLMACQLLALSPFARDLRLEKYEHATIFDQPLNDILEVMGRAYRVIP